MNRCIWAGGGLVLFSLTGYGSGATALRWAALGADGRSAYVFRLLFLIGPEFLDLRH